MTEKPSPPTFPVAPGATPGAKPAPAASAGAGQHTPPESVSQSDTKAKADASPAPREIGGPAGPEPTRFGDWEQKGRCTDF